MKHRVHSCHAFGYAALPLVSGLALMFTLSLAMLFKRTLMNRDQAAQAQLSVDYHQREDALLQAVVTLLPEKAIACLKADLEAGEGHAWADLFNEAVAVSGGSERLSPAMVTALGLARMRSGDAADQSAVTVRSRITSLTGEAGKVTPGTTAFAEVFSQPAFAGKVPPLLDMSGALQEADAERPILSDNKKYVTQEPGLLADVAAHPTFNLIPYPNIRFGYAAPGEPFVAKRNWWAFTVHYDSRTGRAARHYVLSLYEVPSQMPIEASAFASIGRHQDGTAWNANTVSIQGSVYADRLQVTEAYGADRLAGRSAVDLTQEIQLGGTSMRAGFDALGERERLQAASGSEALPAAISANSGRLAFFPLPTGSAYLQRPAADLTTTLWDSYIAGAGRCPVTVEALAMVSYEDQTPVKLRVRFAGAGGGTQEVILERGVNWPTVFEDGGAVIPFQTELTNSSRSCLTFHPSLLDAWLQSHGGESVVSNHSLYFGVDTTVDPLLTVRALSDPPAAEDMCVIIRQGKDITGYGQGLSVAGPLRVYVGDDLNAVPLAAVPAGSGLPVGTEFYPPLSIYAAEVRVGTTGFNRPIDHRGQLGSLAQGGTASWRPLDMKSGSDDAVHTDSISAELKPLRSPAELPPVHPMNWLVVVEEILPD